MKGDKSFIIKKFKFESCEENLHLDSSFLKELAQKWTANRTMFNVFSK